MRCLVTGATGYIGGRLVPRLLDAGHEVRCMTRSKARLRDVPWARRVEVAEADALDAGALRAALAGVDVAYYLIHSMDTGSDFEETDRDRRGDLRGRGAGRRGRPARSTSAAWPRTTRSCRRTCAPAPRSRRSCWPPGCRPRCCELR